METLDKIDYPKLVQKNIWIGGYSDPTMLLYLLTVKYDLATIYGFNAKSYDDLDATYQKNNLRILKGEEIIQESLSEGSISINGDFVSSGVLIGGCLDAFRNLFGTEFDTTKEFIAKYRDKKIVWYFDIYEMNSVDTYLTLLQMKLMGYFNYSDTFLIGKIMHPTELDKMTYAEVYKKIFEGNNIVYDADIGHVRPSFTLINGSMAKINYRDGKIKIQMEEIDANNG